MFYAKLHEVVRRKRTAPGLKLARQLSKQQETEVRAKAIGASVVFKKRRAKFNQVAAIYNGQKYASLGEAEYASKLDLRKAAGEILDWYRPKPIVLVDAPTARGRITIIPDFYVQFRSNYGRFYDYKGSRLTETPVFRIKAKLWAKTVPHELWVVYPSGEEKQVCNGKITA